MDGVTPQGPKKRILPFIKIEAGIIGIIALIVVLLLVIFKVIPLNLPFLTENKTQRLTAVSEDPSYTLKIIDERGLYKLLVDWGIYDKNFNGGYGILGGTGAEPVKSIIVKFTTVEQPVNHYVTPEGKVYLSSVTNALPGKLTINVHIGELILADAQKSKDLGSYFDFIFLSTMYRLADPAKSIEKNKEIEAKLNAFFTEKAKSKKYYFKLSKK